MRRILVLRGGALGDLIVTLPALDLLRRRWPLAHIELVGNTVAGAIPAAAGLVDRVHSQHEARWAALYGSAPLSREFGDWLADFDLVLNFWPDPDRELRTRFPARRGQTFLSGEAHPTQPPAAVHYCEILRSLGLRPEATWYDLSKFFPAASDPPSQFAAASADRGKLSPSALSVATPIHVPRTIALHPGSGSRKKNWPLDRWGELARWLQRECEAEVFVIRGPAETVPFPADWGRAIHNPTLLQLAAELRRCRLFLGHDSGIGHLAAAVRLQSILLFGPTDAAMWAPPAPHVRVIQRGANFAGISLAAVQVAVRAALGDR